jgi:hypothetical protein
MALYLEIAHPKDHLSLPKNTIPSGAWFFLQSMFLEKVE